MLVAAVDLFSGHLVAAETPRLVALEELGVLQARARVEDDDLLVLPDPAVTAQPLSARDRRAAFGTHQHSLGRADRAHRRGDLRFADGDRGATRLAEGFEDDEVSERLRHA